MIGLKVRQLLWTITNEAIPSIYIYMCFNLVLFLAAFGVVIVVENTFFL